MVWTAISEKIRALYSDYKYVALVVLVGVVLMTMPQGSREAVQAEETLQQSVEQNPASELEDILSQMKGVGQVRVLLTEQLGAETVYQSDEDLSSDGSKRLDTVIISDDSRTQSGLIRYTVPAVYLGAIVVCQGAEDPNVRLAVVEAVADVTGLGTDRITVVKMK